MLSMDAFAMVKLMLDITDESQDALLQGFLDMAENEILSRYYDEQPTELSATDVNVQIFAVVEAFSRLGAEGVDSISDGGASFKYAREDMIAYIDAHAPNRAKVV